MQDSELSSPHREAEKSRWGTKQIAGAAIAGAVGIILWAFFVPGLTRFRSGSEIELTRYQGNTSEWLGWFGLVGLAVAIWQLVRTKNAADSARDASEKSYRKASSDNAANSTRGAVDTLREISNFLQKGTSHYYESLIGLQSAVDAITKIEANLFIVKNGNAGEMKFVRALLTGMRSSMQNWIVSPPSPDVVLRHVQVIETQRDKLMAMIQRLRAEPGAGT
jgi:hypothetical protein